MIVADLRVDAGQRTTQSLKEGIEPRAFRPLAVNPRPAGLRDDSRPFRREGVEQPVRDFAQGLIPTDPLPSSRAALAGPL